MRSLIVTFFTFISLSVSVYGQAWRKEFERPKCFIENQGQFDEYENEHTGKIRYAADFGKAKAFFGIKGISYVFLDAEKPIKSAVSNAGITSLEDHKQWERRIGKYTYTQMNSMSVSQVQRTLSSWLVTHGRTILVIRTNHLPKE